MAGGGSTARVISRLISDDSKSESPCKHKLKRGVCTPNYEVFCLYRFIFYNLLIHFMYAAKDSVIPAAQRYGSGDLYRIYNILLDFHIYASEIHTENTYS